MDSVRALIEGVLPPAGNRIALPSGGDFDSERQAVQALFPGKVLSWVDSGTSALALALLDLRHRRSTVPSPEVIIPAYCCPDLVSAALYAGFTPVTCDMAPDSCHYDLESLRSAISEQTLAVIAINFLGLPEPISAIQDVLRIHGVAIIEDNAQWFPSRPGAQRTLADYQTFSFGRGKPVNLLGGGLMVSATHPPLKPGTSANSSLKRYAYYGKCGAYNALLHPFLYQSLARNPLVKLGETRYHEHFSIGPLPAGQRRILTANIQAYWSHERLAERAYRAHLSSVNRLGPLLSRNAERLLRYPLLTDSPEQRNELLNRLNARGLGATTLYSRTIDCVEGVPGKRLSQVGGHENASTFASCFLTLPVHEGVTQQHIERTLTAVKAVLGGHEPLKP